MRKLLFLLLLGTIVVSTGAWSLVVIDDGFEDYDLDACLAPGSTQGEPGLGTWEYAWGTDPADTGRARVTGVLAATGEQSAKWKVPPGTVSSANTVIWSKFPIEWVTGIVTVYMDCAMNATGGVAGNGELCTIKFFDDSPTTAPGGVITPAYHPKELCRVRYQKYENGTSAFGIRGASIVDLVTNPINNTWYHFKIEFNLTAKTYSAYVGDGDRSGENSGHWTQKVTNDAFMFPGQGLKYLWWTMWTRGSEGTLSDPAYCYLDNVYVEGPSRHVPAISSPGDNCGWSPQFRYFTLAPTFTWEVDPHSAHHVKVFDKATVEAAGFNAETATAVWDSGVISSSGNSCTVTAPLPASNLSNPPSNILYVCAKAWLNEFGAWGAWSLPDKDFVCASSPPALPYTPSIGSPAGYVTSTDPPTVAFSVAAGDWDQSLVELTDLTAGGVVYSTNWQTGASPVNLATAVGGDPATCPDLIADHTYEAKVRVRKGCVDGAEGYESAYGTSQFVVYQNPDPPTVTNPVNPDPGLYPVVQFTGAAHTLMQVKIVKELNGEANEADEWDTGFVSSPAYGANCPVELNPGTLYHAYVRVANPLGESPWSEPSSFQVSRDGEAIDIRHMDETDLLEVRSASPDDMFSGGLPTYDQTACKILQPPCSPGILRVTDCGIGGLLRRHNCPVNFNKGTTVVAAVRTWVPPGVADLGEGWKAGTILVTDADSHCGASIKVRPDLIGICTDGTTWEVSVLPSSNDFRVIRITAKAATFNDPTSITWNVYVDETPQLTATGAISQAQLETGVGSWATSQIAIGQGSFALQGIFDFDWTAVNGSGAYGPGDWDQALLAYVPPLPPSTEPTYRNWKLRGGAYASVSDAIENGETGWATISTSKAVINHVGTIAYYVQDAATGAGSLKIDEVGSPANLGKAISSISGMLSGDGVVSCVKNATVAFANPQPNPALSSSPLVTNIRVLGGSPCVTQLVEIGGPYVPNKGRLMRVYGSLPANPSDPGTPVPGYPSGAQIFYVDDLSGSTGCVPEPGVVCAEGGSDYSTNGLRILLDMEYEAPIWTPGVGGIGQGEMVQVTGVSSLDYRIQDGVLRTIRKLADPVITHIPK